ncbi:unnamed protein product [Calypogeia fissa]
MSGSNAIATGATVCSVSGRLGQQQQTGSLQSFRQGGSSKSGTACATLLLRSASENTKLWRSCSAGGAEHLRACAAGKAVAVAEIESTLWNTRRRDSSGSNLSSVAIHHHRISTLSCFQAATCELVSCYGRLSGEIQNVRGRRGMRPGIVKAELNYEREEQRWIREEQRWFREEQRWLREEQRWERDEVRLTKANQALQEEVRALKKELEELRDQRDYGEEITDVSLRNLVTGMKNLLQALAIPGSEDLPVLDNPEVMKQIPGAVSLSEGSSTTLIVGRADPSVSPVDFVAAPDRVIAVVAPKRSRSNNPAVGVGARNPPQAAPKPAESANGATSNAAPTPTINNAPPTTPAAKKTMKSGMEGNDVKELHDALTELGFYSGEEDIEFSVFSHGTEDAVKTWQATQGVPEDGRVTAELMAALLAEVAANVSPTKDGAKSNSEPTAKATQPTPATKQPAPSDSSRKREIDKYERSDAQETGTGSSRRVYLLGENRWEEPGRVQKKQEEERRIKLGQTTRMKVVVETCFVCRGVGTMLCTDCEGTGDLNVEEQFLEWLDEGEAKCPYCDGSGAVECEVCFAAGVKIEK